METKQTPPLGQKVLLGQDVPLYEGECIEELLEGDLRIIQNKSLYRFTSDAVLTV